MDPVRVPSIPAASFPLPPRLEGLRRLAYNLHWAWHPRTRNLWSLIDRTAWTRYRNPIPVISGPTEWSRLLDDEKFLAEYHDVLAEFDRVHGQRLATTGSSASTATRSTVRSPTSAPNTASTNRSGSTRAASGVLAGDHMKSASDMALPFIGVGLLYRKGYFRQTIDADGHQEHDYPDYDLSRLPLGRVQDANGPAADGHGRAARPRPGRRGLARPGRARAGPAARHGPRRERRRGPADHPHPVRPRPRDAPPPGARPGHRRRPRDPGARARAGGLAPQRGPLRVPARRACPRATSPPASRSTTPGPHVRRDSVFTIHTPVSAGNERFEADLVRRVAGPAARRRRRAGRARPRARARASDGDRGQFDMTAFSLRLTNGANAVSQLHAETANATWQGIDRPRRSCGITNGIHGPTWVGQPIVELLARTSTPTSTTSTRARGRAASGSASTQVPARRPVGGPPAPEARARRSSPAAGCAASSPATARRRPSWPSSRRRSIRTS